MRTIGLHNTPKNRAKRRGSGLVEFALVCPVLITLLLGIMEFGLLARDNLTLANAAREGARSGSLGATKAQINKRVTSAAAPLSLTAAKGGRIDIEQSVDGTTYTTAPDDMVSSNAVPQGHLLRVTIVARHLSLTGFFPFLKDKEIQGSATFRKE
ncbi:MAG TPA: TadE/TadG family type IV pilus assembly protein [Abditibacterium sp.]